MTEYRVKEEFEGYPDGISRRVFRPDETITAPADVPEEYGDLLVEKGHVERVKAPAKKESSK